MDRAEARMDKFDRSLEGIRKIIQTGMKMLAQMQQESKAHRAEVRAEMKELRTEMKELAASQKVTDKKLQAYFDSLRPPRNGHNGH